MTLRTTLLRWTARILLTSIADAVDWDEIDLSSRVDDDRLANAVDWDDLDVEAFVDPDAHWGAPVERLYRLEDDPGRGYVWLVESEAAERQWSALIEREYLAEYGREPDAAHFVISDLERLREFDPDDVRMIDPAGVATDDGADPVTETDGGAT